MNLFRTESQILWLLFVLATFSCHPQKKPKKNLAGSNLREKKEIKSFHVVSLMQHHRGSHVLTHLFK